jgi:hypothetical protein
VSRAILMAALGTCIVVIAAPAAHGQGHQSAADSLLSTIGATQCVQTFLLTGSPAQEIGPGNPTIQHYRIAALGLVPSRQQLQELSRLVLRASHGNCGEPTLCEFAPRYAIRFVADQTPLDLLVSEDCRGWRFWRGDLADVPGVGPYTSCIQPDLQNLMEAVFRGVATPR